MSKSLEDLEKKFNNTSKPKLFEDLELKNALDNYRQKIDIKEKEVIEKESIIQEKEIIISELKNHANVVHENNLPSSLVEIEEQLNYLKNQTGKSIWLVGQRLQKIKDESLYAPDYKDFTEYCIKKFEFSRQMAYRSIFIFENFSHVKASLHGTKLELLQRIEDKDLRNELLEWMDATLPSYRSVLNKVNQYKLPTPSEDKQLQKSSENIIDFPKKRNSQIRFNRNLIPEENLDDFMKILSGMIENVKTGGTPAVENMKHFFLPEAEKETIINTLVEEKKEKANDFTIKLSSKSRSILIQCMNEESFKSISTDILAKHQEKIIYNE